MIDIEDMVEGSRVQGKYLLSNVQLKNYLNKPGKYLSVDLMDKTGTIRGVLWEEAEKTFDLLAKGIIVEVHGCVKEFNGNLQIRLNEIKDVGEDYNSADYMMIIEKYNETEEEFLENLERQKEGIIWNKLLIEKIFTEEYLKKFCRAPAALKYHHAKIGGLMQHTLKVIKNAETIADSYPSVDKKLVMLGALLHDIGKTDEFNYDTFIEYSTKGSLLGHIILGCMTVVKALDGSSIEIDADSIEMILHIIASHHGQLEFGSPVQPMCMEASIVHIADMLDAEMDKYHMNNADEGKVQWNPLLKRYVYNKTQVKDLSWDELLL